MVKKVFFCARIFIKQKSVVNSCNQYFAKKCWFIRIIAGKLIEKLPSIKWNNMEKFCYLTFCRRLRDKDKQYLFILPTEKVFTSQFTSLYCSPGCHCCGQGDQEHHKECPDVAASKVVIDLIVTLGNRPGRTTRLEADWWPWFVTCPPVKEGILAVPVPHSSLV